MKMLIAGDWVDASDAIEVRNPYDNSVVDTVPKADDATIAKSLDFAVEGAKVMRKTSGYERYEWLMKAAQLMGERKEDLARTLTMEEGKTLTESRGEIDRSIQTLIGSAEEAKRLGAEVVPLDGAPGSGNRLGFTMRVPCGVVVAISPFNFPMNLVCHKVGPGLAAGNSVLLKPATDTPLSALKLGEILLEAGVPAAGIQVITGSGRQVGNAICGDERVRKITFTGSKEVGEQICRTAGLKKVTMELGSNSPVIVMPDADIEKAAAAIAATGYSNAGQVCISTQRVVADRAIYADLIDALKPKVEALKTGDPMAEGVNVGPMVREDDAKRVESWINDAQQRGARLVAGGSRNGATYAPTVLANVDRAIRISCDELFGPAVGVTPAQTIDEATE
ncbi:MAG: aldehyde dehydrogenase family protein, partial [Acidobacteria bacterium]|nr:aldehyde dehydrogenase family protein [Acidobacteriota bacterium]